MDQCVKIWRHECKKAIILSLICTQVREESGLRCDTVFRLSCPSMTWTACPLQMTALHSFETSGITYPMTRRRIPEDPRTQRRSCEKVKDRTSVVEWGWVLSVGKESSKLEEEEEEEEKMMMMIMMITSVILHKLTPSHRTVKLVEHGTWAVHNNEKNITLVLHGQFETGR